MGHSGLEVVHSCLVPLQEVVGLGDLLALTCDCWDHWVHLGPWSPWVPEVHSCCRAYLLGHLRQVPNGPWCWEEGYSEVHKVLVLMNQSYLPDFQHNLLGDLMLVQAVRSQ